jgi:hypothetical protein
MGYGHVPRRPANHELLFDAFVFSFALRTVLALTSLSERAPRRALTACV